MKFLDGYFETPGASSLPLDGYNGVLMDWQGMPGAVASDLAVGITDYLIFDTDVTYSFGNLLDRDVDGFYYQRAGQSWNSLFAGVLPAKVGDIRTYQLTGKFTNTDIAASRGCRLLINRNDAGPTSSFICGLYWSGSAYTLYIDEWNGSSGISRGSVAFTAAMDQPAPFILQLQDCGDGLIFSAHMHETDDPSAVESVKLTHYAASRPYQNDLGFRAQFNDISAGYVGLKSLRVFEQ